MNINEKKHDIPETFVLKEIDLVQSCINRMAANSFDIKKWSVGIIAILAGLLKQNMLPYNCKIGALFLMVIIVFWGLDAFFLKTEKLYRKKYSWIIKNRAEGNFSNLFDLNPYNKDMMLDKGAKMPHLVWVILSKTLFPFYTGLIAFCVVIFI